MKKNNQPIDTLVLITNRQLLKDNVTLDIYGKMLARSIESLRQKHIHVIDHTLQKSSYGHIHKESDWIMNCTNLYTLCRDTDLSFEEYLQLCDTIGSTVVYHGKVITTPEQLEAILHRQPRIHMPTNLIRYWQSKQEELWNTLQSHWDAITVWSTVHNEDDIRLLASLSIPKLEYVLISPIYPTPCKEGHPGIGVKQGMEFLKDIQKIYPNTKGIALGGIHKSNYIKCLQHTFTGVAVMSDFMKRVHSNIYL